MVAGPRNQEILSFQRVRDTPQPSEMTISWSGIGFRESERSSSSEGKQRAHHESARDFRVANSGSDPKNCRPFMHAFSLLNILCLFGVSSQMKDFVLGMRGGMGRLIAVRPFEELNLGHNLWPDPNTLLHLLGGQRLALRALRVSGRLAKGHAEIASGLRFSSPRKPVCSRKANVP